MILKHHFAVAATCAALAINNPTGHILLHDVSMRIKYDDEYRAALADFGDISFTEFRKDAELYFTSSASTDFDFIVDAVAELKPGANVFCIQPDKEKPQFPQDDNLACHAVCSRRLDNPNEKTLVKKLAYS